MRRAGSIILALCAAGVCLPPAHAEIKHKVEEGGIVITNMPDKRRITRRELREAASRRASRPEGDVPASPPSLAGYIDDAASRYGFDPALIRAVVAAESAFDRMAVSKKGARGLMQLMPETARRFGVRDMHDPEANLEAGVVYLRELVGRFGGDVTLALAAYNAGPEAVARYGGVPPYEETRKYLRNIQDYYGDDLDEGDWSSRESAIHIVNVEKGGVPHFTNLPTRRLVGGTARPKGETGKPE